MKSQPALKSLAGSIFLREDWGGEVGIVSTGHRIRAPLRKDRILSDLPTVNTDRLTTTHLFSFCKKYQISVPFLIIHSPMYFVFVNFILLFIFLLFLYCFERG